MKYKISNKILFVCLFKAVILSAESEIFNKDSNQCDEKGQFMMGPNGYYDKLSFPENMKSIRYWEMVMK
jgi:hypothetical protein